MTCHKDGDDGEQILGELVATAATAVCGPLVTIARSVAENHEPCASLAKEELHEVEPEAAEPVTVCDGNLFDISVENASQKGLEAWSLPVESGADVADKLVISGTLLTKVGKLSLEIASLVFATDSRVSDLALFFPCSSIFCCCLCDAVDWFGLGSGFVTAK